MWKIIIAILIVNTNCDIQDDSESFEKTRLVVVDAVHNIKIDKNTIITSNLKLGNKGRTVKENHANKDEQKEPDWSYNSIPQELSPYVLQFKKNMSECLKEVHDKDKRTVKRLSPKQESPVHGECLIACVLKRNGVIEKGKIKKENLITLVNKFFAKDAHMMKKLEKNIDRCVEMSAKITDECKLAAQLNECTNDLMASNKRKIMVNF